MKKSTFSGITVFEEQMVIEAEGTRNAHVPDAVASASDKDRWGERVSVLRFVGQPPAWAITEGLCGSEPEG